MMVGEMAGHGNFVPTVEYTDVRSHIDVQIHTYSRFQIHVMVGNDSLMIETFWLYNLFYIYIYIYIFFFFLSGKD